MLGSTLAGSLDGPSANAGVSVRDVDALVSPSDPLNVVEEVSNNAGGVTDALPPITLWISLNHLKLTK